MTENLGRLMTMRQLTEQINLSRSTIHRMVKRGNFPAPLRVGQRAVRWREADVVAWQEEKSRDSQD